MYDESGAWLALIMTLGAQQGAVRIRVWRALKSLGAGGLRDGVYLLPARDGFDAALREQASAIETSGGSAFVLRLSVIDSVDEARLRALFDRSEEYAAFLASLDAWVATIESRTELEGRRGLRQLKRDYDAIVSTDFFPSDSQEQTRSALLAAETAFTRAFAPEEPVPVGNAVERLEFSDFRGRVWATRKRLWVDRVASAWLIRRFIDHDARFLWLERPEDCPVHAIGFDFDGARFTHVGERITFEVLLESFGLSANVGLSRVGLLVRSLDVGTVHVAEAPGFEAMLTGARERYPEDDALLSEVAKVLDCLYIAYTSDVERKAITWATADRPSGKSTAIS